MELVKLYELKEIKTFLQYNLKYIKREISCRKSKYGKLQDPTEKEAI
jgi:hypothetical protein